MADRIYMPAQIRRNSPDISIFIEASRFPGTFPSNLP